MHHGCSFQSKKSNMYVIKTELLSHCGYCKSLYPKLACLLVQRICTKLHRARNDFFSRDGVEDSFVLEKDEANICDYLPLVKLLTVEDLNVRNPNHRDEVRLLDSVSLPLRAGSQGTD